MPTFSPLRSTKSSHASSSVSRWSEQSSGPPTLVSHRKCVMWTSHRSCHEHVALAVAMGDSAPKLTRQPSYVSTCCLLKTFRCPVTRALTLTGSGASSNFFQIGYGSAQPETDSTATHSDRLAMPKRTHATARLQTGICTMRGTRRGTMSSLVRRLRASTAP